MTTAAHLDTQRLTAYLLGQLPANEFEEVVSHLTKCNRCRLQAKGLDEYTSSDPFLVSLRGSVGGPDSEPLPRLVRDLVAQHANNNGFKAFFRTAVIGKSVIEVAEELGLNEWAVRHQRVIWTGQLRERMPAPRPEVIAPAPVEEPLVLATNDVFTRKTELGREPAAPAPQPMLEPVVPVALQPEPALAPPRSRRTGCLLVGVAVFLLIAIPVGLIVAVINHAMREDTSTHPALGDGPDEPVRMAGHINFNCSSLVITPDGLRAVSRCSDGQIFLWDLKNRGLEYAWSVPADGGNRYPGVIAVAPDGSHIGVSVGENLGLFDPKECKPGACKPDVTVRCSANPNDRERKFWSAAAFAPPSPDGDSLAVAETEGQHRCFVYITPVASLLARARKPAKPDNSKGKRSEATDSPTVSIVEAQPRTFPPLGGPILCLAFSSDGKLLVGGGSTKVVELWNVKDGTPKRQFKGHEGVVTQVAVSSDGKRIFSASAGDEALLTSLPSASRPQFDGTLRIWDNDAKAGDVVEKELGRIEPGKEQPDSEPRKSASPVTCAAFWPQGRALTGHKDGTIALWDLDTKKILKWFSHKAIRETKEAEVTAVAISPDGNHALAAIKDGSVCIYRLKLAGGKR